MNFQVGLLETAANQEAITRSLRMCCTLESTLSSKELFLEQTVSRQLFRASPKQQSTCFSSKSLENIFGPRAAAVILKIPHPFKYPGLGVMSFE